MHAIVHKGLRRFRDASNAYNSRDKYGSNGPSKSSYVRQDSDGRQKSKNLSFGGITKSTDVNVYRTERSSSDVELVDRDRLPSNTEI